MKKQPLAKIEPTPLALADMSIDQLGASFEMLDRIAGEHDNSHTIARLLQGFVLSELKGKLGHGNFGKWLKKAFPKSHDSAGRYMRASHDFAQKLSDPKFRKRAEFAPQAAIDLLRKDLKATLERLDKTKLDLGHPMVRAAALYAKGRSFNQILLDLGPAGRGGDNTPRDANGKRIANRRRTKAEIEREEFEEEAFETCRNTAKALRAMLAVEGPEEEPAWAVLSDGDLEKLRSDLFEAYEGVLEIKSRRKSKK